MSKVGRSERRRTVQRGRISRDGTELQLPSGGSLKVLAAGRATVELVRELWVPARLYDRIAELIRIGTFGQSTEEVILALVARGIEVELRPGGLIREPPHKPRVPWSTQYEMKKVGRGRKAGG